MQASPIDLSKHFAHTTILASAGITVKGMTPEVTTCPFCGKDRLSILLDPVYIGPKWLHCAACHWSGDPIEIYEKITKAGGLEEAIKKAIVDGVCLASPEQTSPSNISRYVKHYPNRRAAMSQIWTALTSQTDINPHPNVVKKLQELNLWAGAGSKFQLRMKNILGAATKGDIRKVFDAHYIRADHELPKFFPSEGFQTCLCLAYQDVPGRICAFQFLGDLGKKKENYIKLIGKVNGDICDGGLAMLDQLDAVEPVVFAVSDPLVALQLHRRRFIEFDVPIKVVLYNRDTKVAWRSLNTQKVVFWDKAISMELFEQARRVGNGHICVDPWYYTESGELSKLASGPQVYMLCELERAAKPWPEVFVKWATAPDRTETEAAHAFDRLKFTPSEHELLISAATDEERFRLENFMGAAKRPRSAQVGGYNVVEQGHTWSIVWPKKQETITEATIRIDEELSDTLEGTSYLKGYILYRGQKIPFLEATRELEAHPIAWITTLTNKAGLGTPRIAKKYDRLLIDIARALSSPRVRAISSKLGLQPDGTIVFPRFSLVGGQPVVTDDIHPDLAIPLGAILPPIRRSADSRDTVSPARSAVIASFCAFATNWVGLIREVPTLPVAIVGGPGSVAQISIRHLVKTMGLRRVELGRRAVEVLDLAVAKAKYFNCPCYVERNSIDHSYTLNPSDHLFISLTAPEAASLRVSSHPWITITNPLIRQDNNPLPPIDDLVWYLADLQKRDFELPKAKHDVFALLEDMCKWYERYVDRDQTETLAQASQMLRVSDSAGFELIRLAHDLIRMGFLRADHETIGAMSMGAGNRVLLDIAANRVFIPRWAFTTTVSHMRIPLPDFHAAAQDLVERHMLFDTAYGVEGWLIALDSWNDVIKTQKTPLN